MLDNVQIIRENNEAKFAVIDFKEYQSVKELLSDEEKLEDYLDYLHIQKAKAETQKMYSLEEVRKELGFES
jgi:hypothetical protein